MKKGQSQGEDQLSFLGPTENSIPKPIRKEVRTAPVRMPSLDPVFMNSKREALAKLESVTSQKTMPVKFEENEAPLALPEEPPVPVTEQKPEVYSVSDVNLAIKKLLEGKYNLLWVKGEISNFKPHTSGHYYFSLKDEKAQISAVMFRQNNSRLGFKPQDGMEVLVRGKITVYEPRGNYQIFCELMEPVGLGALQLAYEQLKQKLEKEGLFDQKKKRPLPAFPQKVAIVTSPTGAAIRDMLNVLGRRFKGLDITLLPVSVQGDKAPGEIVQAIELANKVGGFDVMIVGRGGGSIEDLWAFNNENVCRAIAASKIPTVSAVGHEIDFTLADFVADLRAPTPSAAAELIVKNMGDLTTALETDRRRLVNLSVQKIKQLREKLKHFDARTVDPRRRVQDAIIRCDELVQRLENVQQRNIEELRMGIELLTQRLQSSDRFIEMRRSKLQVFAGKLDTLSPLKIVERGYAMVNKDKKVITDHKQLKTGDELKLRFARGHAIATVTKLEDDGIENEMKQRGIQE